jgi:uncharacterized protein DUF742
MLGDRSLDGGSDGIPGLDQEPTWLDHDAGPLVRSFALTGGRAHSGTTFDLLAFVVATDSAQSVLWQTQPEHRAILAHAAAPISLAELASEVDLPLGVVRVLLGDLIELEAIAVQEPAADGSLPDDNVLKAVIHALRTL